MIYDEFSGLIEKTFGLDRFREAIQRNRPFPNKTTAVIFGFVHNILRILEADIADNKNKDTSWAFPWVDINYEIIWDFKQAEPLTGQGVINRLRLAEQELAADWSGPSSLPLAQILEERYQAMQALLDETVTSHHEYAVLSSIHEGVANIIENGEWGELLRYDKSEELNEYLQAAPKRLREESTDAWYEKMYAPFVFGLGEPIDVLNWKLPEPMIHVTDDESGNQYEGIVIIQISPLVVDMDTQEAYVPITAGLALWSHEEPPARFEEMIGRRMPEEITRWKSKEKKKFWSTLYDAITRATLPEENEMMVLPPLPDKDEYFAMDFAERHHKEVQTVNHHVRTLRKKQGTSKWGEYGSKLRLNRDQASELDRYLQNPLVRRNRNYEKNGH